MKMCGDRKPTHTPVNLFDPLWDKEWEILLSFIFFAFSETGGEGEGPGEITYDLEDDEEHQRKGGELHLFE